MFDPEMSADEAYLASLLVDNASLSFAQSKILREITRDSKRIRTVADKMIRLYGNVHTAETGNSEEAQPARPQERRCPGAVRLQEERKAGAKDETQNTDETL